MIDQFTIEGVEGGGIAIHGVFVNNSCYLFLIIMGILFVLGGSLLSVIAFVPQEKRDWTYSIHKSGKTKVAGPLLICVGIIITVAGGIIAFIKKSIVDGEIKRTKPSYVEFSNSTNTISSSFHDRRNLACRSLTIESLTDGIGQKSLPPLSSNYIHESSFIEEKDKISKSVLLHNDIACFPNEEVVTNRKRNRSLNSSLIDVPKICITQPSPVPPLHEHIFSKIKKHQKSSFRIRHKADHNIGLSSPPKTVNLSSSRRSSYHGESPERRPRSSSPHSLPLIVSLYDSYLTAVGPEISDPLDIQDLGHNSKIASPVVDTDSIQINLEKLSRKK